MDPPLHPKKLRIGAGKQPTPLARHCKTSAPRVEMTRPISIEEPLRARPVRAARRGLAAASRGALCGRWRLRAGGRAPAGFRLALERVLELLLHVPHLGAEALELLSREQ